MSTEASPYSIEQLNHLATILERTTPTVEVARDELERQLLDLLQAVGTYAGTEQAVLFREAGKDDLSDATLRDIFQAISTADDPLNPILCPLIALSKLNAAARAKWARRIRDGQFNRPYPLLDVTSDMLSPGDLADVREMALRLAGYHNSLVDQHRPIKTDQDTLLDGLADIYIGLTQRNCHRYELPHAVKSHFIQFAHEAMRPVFGLTEASAKSISTRWKRLKDRHLQGFAQPQS